MDGATRFKIGQAAAASGVTAKMIRHYEALGLIPAPRRTAANYRNYGEREVQMLRFVRRASLGFSTAEIARLLSLWQNRRRSSRQVSEIAARHIEDLERRIGELQSMRRTLQRLVYGLPCSRAAGLSDPRRSRSRRRPRRERPA